MFNIGDTITTEVYCDARYIVLNTKMEEILAHPYSPSGRTNPPKLRQKVEILLEKDGRNIGWYQANLFKLVSVGDPNWVYNEKQNRVNLKIKMMRERRELCPSK